jgi:glucosamine--fructose-6-phosphate aminotransferase (isomerizing)
VSLVRDEIAEQPAVLARLLADDAVAAAGRKIRRTAPKYVVIAARGSSDNAARYAQHLFGHLCRLPVALASPSLHTLYATPPRYHGALVIGISQSGESPDVVGVLEEAGRQGRPTVAITNDPGSPLAAAAGHVIELHAGEEASVAATKTYTASLGAIAALADALAGGERRDELEAMPDALARQLALGGTDDTAAAAAGWSRLAVIGRGANYGTAFEAALKIKELTGAAAEAYSPADFLHGPIAIVQDGFPVVAVAPSGPTLPGMRELLTELEPRGADVTLLTDAPHAAVGGERVIELVPAPDWLSPLVAVVPAQLIAVGAAERLGVDVDRPGGLQKVTRTT